MERDAGENVPEVRWNHWNGLRVGNPYGATCSNCLGIMPEVDAYEDEFCSQKCFDDWMAYQDDCASFEQASEVGQ